jgi:hypothetical protein
VWPHGLQCDRGPRTKGQNDPAPSAMTHGARLYDQGPVHFGVAPNISHKVGYLLYYMDLILIYRPVFVDFGHYWGILGPFLGQILGGSWDMVTNFRYI